MKKIVRKISGQLLSFAITLVGATCGPMVHADCTPPPAGIVAWWPGDDSANDIVGTNNGTLLGGSGFAPGEVGPAFAFNNTNQAVRIAASPSLNVGTASGFTLEAWINCSNPAALNPIFEWNRADGTTQWGAHFYVGAGGPGSLYANVVDSTGGWHAISSAGGIVASNRFIHAALTYDQASGTATIYCDGTNVAQAVVGSFTPQTSYNLYLGSRPGPDAYLTYSGLIDEPSVYERALSPNEIAAIYQAGSAGKCQASLLAPSITAQPQSQTNLAGGTATFSVTASGTAPLSYQWSFNNTNLPYATNATLTLSDIQPSQAGNYSVTVYNLVNSTNSATAVLTVVTSPSSCDPPPAGIVAWWPGDDNANDIVGTNNGTLLGGLGFAPGEVGPAFAFNNTNQAVRIAASPSLNVGAASGFTLEAWINCSNPAALNPIFEWNRADGTTQWGAHFYVGAGGPGSLYANLVDSGGIWHALSSAVGLVTSNTLLHVALTYNRTNGTATIYCDGTNVAQAVVGSFTPQTSYNLYLGSRPGPDAYLTYSGLIDEPSVYERALSPNEIAAIYQAGSAGKCQASLLAPSITAQPQSQTNLAGGTATFSVTASGTAPLSYQWSFNNTNLPYATNATLTLSDIQPSQAGNYSVTVYNLVNSTNSATAVLTVVTSPSSCDPPPAGIVAWWPGDDNANDIVGTNNGTLLGGLGFAPGEVGPAFAFNNTNQAVRIAASPSLNVGAASGFTLEAWINCSNPAALNPIFEWNRADGTTQWGAHFYVGAGGPGSLYANLVDSGGIWHALSSAVGLVTSNTLLHVALTYNRTNGTATIYCDGTNVAQAVVGNFTPQTSYNLYLGSRPGPDAYLTYSGLIDEPSVYERALSANEIAAIYQAGSAGKCQASLLAPSITAQPQSQTNLAGGTATFSVTASGTAPLSYQWSFNNTNLPYATNATLTLSDIQPSQAGNYSVTVYNLVNSTNSATAVLTVVTSPSSCDPPPAGIVAWWPGDDNANDIVGTNNGTLLGGLGFAPGEVGPAFAFDNTNQAVRIAASPSLNVGAASGFTLEAWINCSNPAALNPIFEWNRADGTTQWGAHFYVGAGGPGSLYANVVDSTGGWHAISSAGGIVASNRFIHAALTYDQASGTATIYCDGTNVAQAVVGSFTPQTSYNLYLGSRPGPGAYLTYSGLIDEPSVYERALSANEIAAIYQAGSAGKCQTPVSPLITAQPQSQTNLVGGTATFSVAATGTAPLSYQWYFNNTNILYATNATLTLSEVQPAQAGSYSVTVSNVVDATNSAVATLVLVAPPIITQQPQSLAVASFGTASFTVAATGTAPLSFQWRENGTNLVDGGNLSGSTTTNLVLTGVNLTNAGNYDVVVSNPFAAADSSVAVLNILQTGLALGSGTAYSGNLVVVPVTMNALGVEGTFLTTVGYDPKKLVLQNVQLGQATTGAYLQEVDTATNSGLVGFAILLSSGATVPAGTNQQVALLNFQALPVTSNTTVTLFFTNNPTLQQTYDNTFDLLPTLYSTGTVTLLPAEYEADVYPRTNGDHQVTVPDWLEEGRMVAGLDTPTNADEFLRADCSPRNAPDGVLTVADWVQAGRYALSLDPLTLVATPLTSGVKSSPNLKLSPHDNPAPMRTLLIGTVAAQRGQTVSVPVQLVCTTNENAVGFTISFNTNQLQITGVALGSAMAGGWTNFNSAHAGELGVALALSPGQALKPGTNQLLVLQVTANTNASGAAPLTFNSSVAALQVADKTANALPANYVSGGVNLPPQPAVAVAATAAKLQLAWPLDSGTFQVQTATNPLGPWTTVILPIITNGADAGVTILRTNQQQFYRLEGQ